MDTTERDTYHGRSSVGLSHARSHAHVSLVNDTTSIVIVVVCARATPPSGAGAAVDKAVEAMWVLQPEDRSVPRRRTFDARSAVPSGCLADGGGAPKAAGASTKPADSRRVVDWRTAGMLGTSTSGTRVGAACCGTCGVHAGTDQMAHERLDLEACGAKIHGVVGAPEACGAKDPGCVSGAQQACGTRSVGSMSSPIPACHSKFEPR